MLAPPDAEDEEGAVAMGLPVGPILFHVVRAEDGPLLIPVAELSGDSLRTIRQPPEVAAETYQSRFRETALPIGGQFRLFRRGAAVGTFIIDGHGPANACGVPIATGNLSVVAAAADAPQFLGFAAGLSPEVRGQYNPPQITGSITTYASIVAEKLILQAGLPRPRSWTGAQKDLDAVQVMEGAHPEMSATYLVGDSLAPGPSDPQGYSVFYLADYETARGYNPVYSEVRDYRRVGKQAPALVDYLDWNAQPGADILLQVHGRSGSWYEAISQRRGRWAKVWTGERCD